MTESDPIAEAEQRGREDNTEHAMCYVSGSRALDAILARAWEEGFEAGLDAVARDSGRVNPYDPWGEFK